MARILLIDSDADRAAKVARRLRLRRVETEVEASYLLALTKVEWQRYDWILVHAGASDGMTSAELCATVKQDSALRDVPLALIGRPNEQEATAITRFDARIHDDDTDRLVEKIVALLTRSRIAAADREALDAVMPSLEIETDVEDGSLGGFLQLLELFGLAFKSGRVVIRSANHRGPIYVVLDHGQLVHAVFGALTGAPAFRRLVDDLDTPSEISYRFEPVARWKLGTYPRSIRQAERRRLLEGATRETAASSMPPSLPAERLKEI